MLRLVVVCTLVGYLLAIAMTMNANVADAIDPSYFVNRGNHCMMTGRLPERPAPLSFCYWFNDLSCCVPGWDLDIGNAFVEVSDLGQGCSPSKHSVKSAYFQIREWMCLGCDPKEPTYRFRTNVGDAHLPGGQNPPDSAAPDEDFTWRLCKSWLYGKDGKSGLWGNNASKYDLCGIQFLNDCSAIKQWGYDPGTGQFVESSIPILDGWDPGMCAGDVIFPGIEFGNDPEPAASLLQIIPQFTPDFKFVITDDNATDFNREATPCYRGAAGSVSVMLSLAVALLVVASLAF